MDPAGGLAFGVGLVVVGVVVLAVGRGAARGSIPVNAAMGIRTAATMASEPAWRAGHGAAGPWLIAASVTAVGVGLVTLTLSIGLLVVGDESTAALALPLVGVLSFLALLTRAAVVANTAARALLDREP